MKYYQNSSFLPILFPRTFSSTIPDFCFEAELFIVTKYLLWLSLRIIYFCTLTKVFLKV